MIDSEWLTHADILSDDAHAVAQTLFASYTIESEWRTHADILPDAHAVAQTLFASRS
jgi:hypothetical protein